MQFYIDTADIDEIKTYYDLGIISGVTTNPTLIAKTGRNLEETIKSICKMVEGPVNSEVMGTTADEMVEEGLKMAKWDDNVVIKIPMNAEGLKAVSRLSKEGVKTNVTLIFNPNQALLAAAAGATYVCPFVGRLDDVSSEGMEMVADICEIFAVQGISTEVIAASVRHPMHVLEAARVGVNIVTVPGKVIDQMIDHPLTKAGIDKFVADWQKTGL
jgi:transaldolase